jgi:hypothetical protein
MFPRTKLHHHFCTRKEGAQNSLMICWRIHNLLFFRTLFTARRWTLTKTYKNESLLIYILKNLWLFQELQSSNSQAFSNNPLTISALASMSAWNAPSSTPKHSVASGRATPPALSLRNALLLVGVQQPPTFSFRNVLLLVRVQRPQFSHSKTLCCRCVRTWGRAGHSARGHRFGRQPQQAQQEGRTGRTDGWMATMFRVRVSETLLLQDNEQHFDK